MDLLKKAKADTNICTGEGESCCWFIAASTLAEEAGGLQKLS